MAKRREYVPEEIRSQLRTEVMVGFKVYVLGRNVYVDALTQNKGRVVYKGVLVDVIYPDEVPSLLRLLDLYRFNLQDYNQRRDCYMMYNKSAKVLRVGLGLPDGARIVIPQTRIKEMGYL